MNPSLRNLFMKKLTRDRVVPIISASVCWLIFAIIGSGFPSLPKFASSIEGRSVPMRALRSKLMSSHMPPVPPANRSPKGPGGSDPKIAQDTSLKHEEPRNTSEQGETANIKQNTTNEGFFRGRRIK